MTEISKPKPKLGDILTRLELVTDEQVQAALEYQSESGKLFGESLLALESIGEDDLSWALSSQLGFPFVAVTPEMGDPTLVAQFPIEFLRKNLVLPLVASDTTLSVVLADPTDDATLARLERISGYDLNVAVGTPTALRRALEVVLEETRLMKAAELSGPASTPAPAGLTSPEMSKLLDRARTHGATSVHLDPDAERVRVRFRTQDGKLTEGGWFEPTSLRELLSGLSSWLGEGDEPAPGVRIWDAGPTGLDAAPFGAVSVSGSGGTSITLLLDGNATGTHKISAPYEEEWARFDGLLRRPRGLIVAVAPSPGEQEQLLARLLGRLDASTRRTCAIVPDALPVAGGVIRFSGEHDTDTIRAFGSISGVDVLIGTFDNTEAAAALAEAGSRTSLVLATLPGNSALGFLAGILEAGVSSTLLSESLLAVIAQRLLSGQSPEAPARALTESLFMDLPLRRALQAGGSLEDLRAAAREQDFVEVVERARRLKGVDHRVIEDLERHSYLGGGMSLDVHKLLAFAMKRGASDLHLSAGMSPMVRLHGEITRLDVPPIESDQLLAMLHAIMTEDQKREFNEGLDFDFAIEVENSGRFRVNLFMQTRGPAAVFRTIPTTVPTIEDLGMPKVLADLAMKERGLILVTGPTGSGKSTTLAAMVHHINENRRGHIITVEDPIEFVHPPRNCLINQREVGRHTHSFANALRSALREDPDAILVGELRDLETTQLAITAAETGHVVFGTLHTNSAAKTVDRIIDIFPAGAQAQIRAMFSESIVGIISQILLKKKTGDGRVCAYEILVAVPAIRNLIREEKASQIISMIQTGAQHGMMSMDQCLKNLVMEGKVTPEDAAAKATAPSVILGPKAAPGAERPPAKRAA